MSAERTKLLEDLPGWTWFAQAEAWERAYSLLEDFARENGHAQVPSRSEIEGVHLGRWIEGQRKFYARGTLDPERIARLEAIPGWCWETSRTRAAGRPSAAVS